MNLPLGWWRLMKAEGARILFWTAIVSVLSGVWVGMVEGLFLAMPPRLWTLSAADSYAQYGSILIGLWMVAGYVELGRRALPTARVAVAESADEARNGPGPSEALEATAGSAQPSRSA